MNSTEVAFMLASSKDDNHKSSGHTYEPVDYRLVDAKAAGSAGYLLRVHPRDFVQVTHTEAGERF